MLQFYGSVDDIANTLDVYSDLDGHSSKLEYQYGNQQYLSEIETLNSLVESMAITEYNMNGYQGDKQKTQMYQMQVPQFYEMIRNKKNNMSIIRDSVKDG